jgi:microcystin degradation protein MlrC
VASLSDGNCVYSGKMYGGGTATLGPSAALLLEGSEVHVVVTSIRNQCLDLAHFHHFGLKPETARIVCVKSTAHFRADFAPIAQETLLVAVPGQFPCILEDVIYRNLRPGVRLGPNGPIYPRPAVMQVVRNTDPARPVPAENPQ